MRLLQLDAIGHFGKNGTERYAIYSLDVQPVARFGAGDSNVSNYKVGNSNVSNDDGRSTNGSCIINDSSHRKSAWHVPRLATAGGDCCVRLWDLEALLRNDNVDSRGDPTHENTIPPQQHQKQQKEDTPAAPVQLACMSNHTKSVNVVRWSRCGRFLASGSDDSFVLIYMHTPNSLSNSRTFGSSFGGAQSQQSAESWSRCFALRGHHMDVLDVAWSGNGSESGSEGDNGNMLTLASASVDNSIHIWLIPADAQPAGGNSSSAPIASTLLSPVRTLRQHSSFVKGLAFDPIGRYLLSSGSDNRILVWDASKQFSLLQSLDEPLRGSNDRTLFRRCCWAPDAHTVCVTAAQKTSKPVGMVLQRGSWQSVADLVGHSAPSISCRFLPVVLRSPPMRTERKKSRDATSAASTAYNTTSSEQATSTPIPAATDSENGVVAAGIAARVAGLVDNSNDSNDTSSSSSSSKFPIPSSRAEVGSMVPSEEQATATSTPSKPNGTTSSTASSVETKRKEQASCLLALGDQLGVLSVWSTARSRPLFVLRDLHDGAITDIAWIAAANSGSTSSSTAGSSSAVTTVTGSTECFCCCCGIDGSVNVIAFSEQEVGSTLSATLLEKHYKALYGKQLSEMRSHFTAAAGVGSDSNLSFDGHTTASALAFKFVKPQQHPQQSQQQQFRTSSNSSNENVNAAASYSPEQVLQMQRVTKDSKTGKKRIQPISLSCTVNNEFAVVNANHVDSRSSNGGSEAWAARDGASGKRSSDQLAGNSTLRKKAKLDALMAGAPSGSVQRTMPHWQSQAQAQLTVHFNDESGVMACTVPTLIPTSATAGISTSSATGTTLVSEITCSVREPLLLYTSNTSTSTDHGLESILGSSSSTNFSTLLDTKKLFLTVQKLQPPAALHKMQNQVEVGSICSIALLETIPVPNATLNGRSSNSSGGNNSNNSLRTVWRSAVAGDVTCAAGARDSRCSGDSTASGLCAVGCSDGSLHLLSLSCGMRVNAPLVLGAPVAHVDLRCSTQQQKQHIVPAISESKSQLLYALAVCADGELWVWKLGDSVASSFDMRDAPFSCIIKTNLRPVLLSMKTCATTANSRISSSSCSKSSSNISDSSGSSSADGEAGTEASSTSVAIVRVERVVLSEIVGATVFPISAANDCSRSSTSDKLDQFSAQYQVLIFASATAQPIQQRSSTVEVATAVPETAVGAAAAAGLARRQMRGAEWQAFKYCSDGQCFIRLADLRYVLSRFFCVADCNTAVTSECNSGIDQSTLTMSQLQGLAITGSGFGTRDILRIAAARDKLQRLEEQQHATPSLAAVANAFAAAPLNCSSASAAVESLSSWGDWVSITHIEDRLCVAASLCSPYNKTRSNKIPVSSSTGITECDVLHWFRLWVRACCGAGLFLRVKHVASLLLEQHRRNRLLLHTAATATAVSSTTSGHHISQRTPMRGEQPSWWQQLVQGADTALLIRDAVLRGIAEWTSTAKDDACDVVATSDAAACTVGRRAAAFELLEEINLALEVADSGILPQS